MRSIALFTLLVMGVLVLAPTLAQETVILESGTVNYGYYDVDKESQLLEDVVGLRINWPDEEISLVEDARVLGSGLKYVRPFHMEMDNQCVWVTWHPDLVDEFVLVLVDDDPCMPNAFHPNTGAYIVLTENAGALFAIHKLLRPWEYE